MREIRFRAWDNGCRPAKMLDWKSLKHQLDDAIDDKDVELMQFTGLKDKLGKEIYEGDIVKWSDGDYVHPHNPRVATVSFDPDIQFKTLWGDIFNFGNFIYKDTENHLEVIGNIYENPELLKH